jgi:hypothetical protein
MGQYLEGDQQQPPAKKPENTGLFAHSGFMNGLKTIGHSASGLVNKGVKEGQDLANSETGKKVKAQAIETTRQVMASPVTKRVVSEATQTTKQLAAENVSHVHGAINAAQHRDVAGVIRNAAPIAGEVALGPGGVALNIARQKATEAAISQAPASQRAGLQHLNDLTHVGSLQHLTIAGLTKAEVAQQTHEARRNVTQAALESASPQPPRRAQTELPMQTASAPTGTTSDFIEKLKAKLQQEQTGKH